MSNKNYFSKLERNLKKVRAVIREVNVAEQDETRKTEDYIGPSYSLILHIKDAIK